MTGNKWMTLIGIILALLALGTGVLAGGNHARRWWVLAAVLGTAAAVLLGIALARSGVLMPEFKPLFDLEQ